MESKDCTEIIRRHPELILVSNNPVTWEGMLTVPVNLSEKMKFRMKLTVANYPIFKGAILNFGKNLAVLCSKDFSDKLNSLLKNAQSIPSFLKQFQILIGQALNFTNSPPSMNVCDYSVIEELEAIVRSPCDVRLSSSHGTNLVEIALKDISVRLERDVSTSNCWKVVFCDLAQLQGCELTVGAVMNLQDAAIKLEKQIESLDDVWNQLEDIDRNCWVIDPLVPKPHHLYRRIRITQSLSVLITINPSEPTALPFIKILGSDSEVLKYREIVSQNFELWNSDSSFLENLLLLLNLKEFPRKSSTEDEKHKDGGLFNDEECCICFSLELGEDELPDRVCNNEKCRKHFHTACLLQWLQGIPGNHVIFNKLYGTCPHCGENIPCPLE